MPSRRLYSAPTVIDEAGGAAIGTVIVPMPVQPPKSATSAVSVTGLLPSAWKETVAASLSPSMTPLVMFQRIDAYELGSVRRALPAPIAQTASGVAMIDGGSI